MSNKLSLSLIIVAFILGLSLGFLLSPEYQIKMADKKSAMVEIGKADKFVDLRYIDGMIGHHLNAIYMAKQAIQSSKRPEIVQLGKDIIQADEASIKELYQWKKSWFNNTKEIVNYTKINLGQADNNFDLRFINALIAHHDEAINNAKEIRTKTTRNEILNLADSVIQGLTASKNSLIEFRKNWYKI